MFIVEFGVKVFRKVSVFIQLLMEYIVVNTGHERKFNVAAFWLFKRRFIDRKDGGLRRRIMGYCLKIPWGAAPFVMSVMAAMRVFSGLLGLGMRQDT